MNRTINERNRTVLILALLTSSMYAAAEPVRGQSPESRLGDATAIPASPSQAEGYGINSNVETSNDMSFSTRHSREGNNGGIGSSFLGTTSVTSESKPLSADNTSAQMNSPAVQSTISTPRPRLFSEYMLYSPSLSPLPYSAPALSNSTIATPLSTGAGQKDSVPFDLFWSHQRSSGSIQPFQDSFRSSDFSPKAY